MNIKKLIKTTIFIALLGAYFSTFASEKMIELNTREGVTQSYLLTITPEESPRYIAILFSGGMGNINLKKRGNTAEVKTQNFLIRSREMFLTHGIATAAVDSPSDMINMSDGFRMSDKHQQDIIEVVKDLRSRFPQTKIYLVGTSRGTVSAAYNGQALETQVDGVVLTSSVFKSSKSGLGLASVDFSKIKAPLLFIHHREDACAMCPYDSAHRLAERYPLISVSGGLQPKSGPCDALSPHGYFGKETQTIAAMSQWIIHRALIAEVQ